MRAYVYYYPRDLKKRCLANARNVDYIEAETGWSVHTYQQFAGTTVTKISLCENSAWINFFTASRPLCTFNYYEIKAQYKFGILQLHPIRKSVICPHCLTYFSKDQLAQQHLFYCCPKCHEPIGIIENNGRDD